MTHITKRKYVANELLYEFVLPESHQYIVKVKHCRGNNLHEVWNEKGEELLVSMPPKFRNHFYILKGMFLIVEPIAEGVKVKAEIVRILYKEQINYIISKGAWPEAFAADVANKKDEAQIPDDMLPPSDSDEEDLGTLVNNYNRHVCPAHIPNSDSSDSEEASDDCDDNNSENETLSNNEADSNNDSKDSSDVFKTDNDQISRVSSNILDLDINKSDK
ncbi:probable RNA-binding protein EIF1AD [Octopus bimaculoides]|uniref:Probable RNA-binding protein EIF1AD n=1 Tax=Octopus bimaculoides TaxID=37653 RepID=A0A0L8G1N0_OCTBM|nr:probable RNA-binding protein EIF1AD [Octopus bimaculoides]|eukprot:XP_014785029.1 PREDICTED: probable RNA-binding protein EIF1AD [Octopus bimaculoides]